MKDEGSSDDKLDAYRPIGQTSRQRKTKRIKNISFKLMKAVGVEEKKRNYKKLDTDFDYSDCATLYLIYPLARCWNPRS